jgi:hypothetical protein
LDWTNNQEFLMIALFAAPRSSTNHHEHAMKRTTIRTRAVIIGDDRRHGRLRENALNTLTQDSSLWEAQRMHQQSATRCRMHRNPNQKSMHRRLTARLAGAARSVLTALGIL